MCRGEDAVQSLVLPTKRVTVESESCTVSLRRTMRRETMAKFHAHFLLVNDVDTALEPLVFLHVIRQWLHQDPITCTW